MRIFVFRAAEARNRIRIMRLRYQANRGQEINHLISCQPSALKAVRLQALVPAKSDLAEHNDSMEKLSVRVWVGAGCILYGVLNSGRS